MSGTALRQNVMASKQFVVASKHPQGKRKAPARSARTTPSVLFFHKNHTPLARTMRWHAYALLGACLLSLVSACGATSKEDKAAMGSINSYNSTDQAITPFYVNGYGGVKMGAYSGGGSVCCVVYPKKWYPGLSAKVKWATSSGKSYGDPTETWHEAEVAIEPYDMPGSMNVHFLPNDQVRILISNSTPRAEGYKGPRYPEAPPGWTVHSIDDEAELPPVPALPSDEADLPPPPAPPKREIQ